MNGLWKESH